MNERHHVVNANGAIIHSTDSFESAVRWAQDYDLSPGWSILTTRDGKPVIQRMDSDIQSALRVSQ